MLLIAPGRRHNRDIFSIFFNMKVCCVFSFESPHRGDSNECTHVPFSIKMKKENHTLNYPISAARVFFFEGLKNEFETAVENEPSVFEPLNVYCTYIETKSFHHRHSCMVMIDLLLH